MFIYKRCECERKKEKASITKGKIENITKVLKLVSVPSRLSILTLLSKGPHCVCDIVVHVKISQTLASHYLADLAKANLVTSQKNGNFVDYSLTPQGSKLILNLQKL